MGAPTEYCGPYGRPSAVVRSASRVDHSLAITNTAMSLNAGTQLGPYEIVGLVGAGGMGEVYKGRDTRLDRIVALKVYPRAGFVIGMRAPRPYAAPGQSRGKQASSQPSPAPIRLPSVDIGDVDPFVTKELRSEFT